jgi:predicted adenylyl cyclase CyaB
MREVELKAVVPDEAEARRRLLEAGAILVFEGTMSDRRYDTADRALTARDHVLRLRVQRDAAGERAVVEFKGSASIIDGFKIREETGTSVGDAEAFDGILRSMGFQVTREIDREVAVFAAAGATVRLEPRMDLPWWSRGPAHRVSDCAPGATRGLHRRTIAFVLRFEARTGGTPRSQRRWRRFPVVSMTPEREGRLALRAGAVSGAGAGAIAGASALRGAGRGCRPPRGDGGRGRGRAAAAHRGGVARRGPLVAPAG